MSEFTQKDDIAKNFRTHSNSEWMRQKIISIFHEEIGKVEFAKIVKNYAAEEMDSRVFRSVKYWLIVIITALLSSTIGIFLSKFL